jgi:hypothetical protein
MPTVLSAMPYEQFAPPERLRLVLDAMARRDPAEAARLAGACPRKTYAGPDLAFGDRLDLTFDTTAIVAIDLRASWGQAKALRWAADLARRYAAMHHVDAELAFLDGVACGRGQPQLDYFARREDAAGADDAEDLEPSEDDDEPNDADDARPTRADAPGFPAGWRRWTIGRRRRAACCRPS